MRKLLRYSWKLWKTQSFSSANFSTVMLHNVNMLTPIRIDHAMLVTMATIPTWASTLSLRQLSISTLLTSSLLLGNNAATVTDPAVTYTYHSKLTTPITSGWGCSPWKWWLQLQEWSPWEPTHLRNNTHIYIHFYTVKLIIRISCTID